MKKLVFFGIIIFSNVFAQSSKKDFSEVWDVIRKESKLIQALDLDLEASENELTRGKNHWLPQVYLDVKSYNTNDPGNSFFGLLEQKAVKQADFDPSKLNSPSSSAFTRGALGLNLPLYEGNYRSGMVEMISNQIKSKESDKKAKVNTLYSEALKAYGQIGILDTQMIKLRKIKSLIDKVTSKYQLGNKGNPVGYSGLLGLKSLALKIEGMINIYENRISSLKAALEEMGFVEKNWQAAFSSVQDFAAKYADVRRVDNKEDSYTLEAFKYKKDMSDNAILLEKSRFLPRVGVFAESYLFSGERDTANGYTAGVYLQWNLFKSDEYGLIKESQLKASAADKLYQAQKNQEQAEVKAINIMNKALFENIGLLDSSEKLLDEQTQVSEGMFKNGSMNILQYAEILNRKMDLIVSQTEAHQKYLELCSEALIKSKFVPDNKNK